MKRRDFLRAASGGAAVSATAGVAGAAGADSGAPAQQTGTTTGTGTATTTDGTTATGTTAAPNGTTSPNGTATTSPGGGGGGGTTHDVDMEGVAFTPDSLTIAPGDTVRWTTTGSSNHTVTAYGDELPEGAAYFASGGFESEEAARSAYPDQGAVGPGESYSHTFETLGTYGYFCIPHETAGMTGTIEVVEGGGGGGGEGGGALEPHEMGVPFQAHFVGIATVLMMLVSTIFTFFVVKYGGSPHASSPNRRD